MSAARPAYGPVELAPRHKLGLMLSNPVLLAAGVAGYGDALPPGLDLGLLGGLVTAPVTRRPWHGSLPRVVEVPAGVLWQRSHWNPGVRRVIRDFAPLWRRSPAPIIVHVAGSDRAQLAAAAAPLEEVDGVAGLELDVPTDAREAAARLWAVREVADLPALVRLPLHVPEDTVHSLLEAGVDALVIAQPPAGLHVDPASGQALRGGLHGPALLPQIAARLADLASWVDVPLIASGGIWSVEAARDCLAAGAAALQVDVASWVDPLLPARIAAALGDGPVADE